MKRTSWLLAIMTCIAFLGTALQASALNLTGTITTPNGYSTEIVAGATIVVMPGNYTGVTDAAGRFSITDIPAGTYQVTVAAVGRLGYTMDLALFENKNVVFSMDVDVSAQPVANWNGTVLAQLPGGATQPLAGALIRITPGNYTTYTDDNGNFALPQDLAPGTYTVHVSASGYKPVNDQRQLPPDAPLQYTLQPTGRIR